MVKNLKNIVLAVTIPVVLSMAGCNNENKIVVLDSGYNCNDTLNDKIVVYYKSTLSSCDLTSNKGYSDVMAISDLQSKRLDIYAVLNDSALMTDTLYVWSNNDLPNSIPRLSKLTSSNYEKAIRDRNNWLRIVHHIKDRRHYSLY
jgi:hypothetical protein